VEGGFALSIAAPLAQKRGMENQNGPAAPNRSLWRWAITPPQSYAIYLGCLVLIFVLSFYAGTLKPKKMPAVEPPPVTAPSVPRS
jgi:hypothetical protein